MNTAEHETRTSETPVTVREGDAARPERAESPIKHLLWNTVLSTEPEKEYVPDRTRQAVVFERLPWGHFFEELFGDLGMSSTEGAGKMIRGKLFEMLINADHEFGERTPLEKELLDLAHNPDKYGLGKELGYHRNPDMAFLLMQKADGVEIIGVGESKLGLLNERSFKQLSETGFARGVKALVDIVNTIPDPESRGLHEVAKARAELAHDKPLLTVSEIFSQLLVVPANRHVEWKSTLLNRREFTNEGRQQFYDLLEHHVRVQRAAFSTAEVSALTDAAIRERPVRA